MKLSCRKETVRLTRGSVLVKYNCGMRNAVVSFVLSQCTRLTDRRTDRQTDGQKGLHNTVRCITCSRTVKPLSGPSLPVPVELVSGDVFIVAPEYVDAPEC